MDEGRAEILGFLSRWVLLALVSVCAAGGAYAALSGAAGVTADMTAGMIVPDVLVRPGAKYRLRIQVPGNILAGGDYVLVRMPDGAGEPVASGFVWRGTRTPPAVYTHPRRARRGVERFVLEGVPYGPLAFQTLDALVVGIPPGRHVYALDTRLLGGDEPGLRDLVDRLQRGGTVAFFHARSVERFAAAQRAVRRIDAEVPTVWMEQVRPLAIAGAATLQRQVLTGRPAGSVTVLTGSPELARWASQRGARAVVIGAPNRAAARGAGLEWLSTLAKFKG